MTEYQTATKNGEIVDKYTSPTPDPEPSQASPHCVKHQPTNESSPRGATELKVALEPVPHWSSDQVREPATMHATVESPTHSTTAEGELRQDSGDFIDFYSEVLLPSSSELIVCPETTMEVCFELFICLELSVCPVMTMEVGFELSACLGLLSVCLSVLSWAWCCHLVCVGSMHHLWNPWLSWTPTQPPSPTSSPVFSIILYPTVAASCQPLSSSSAFLLWIGFAVGLSVSCFIEVGGSPVSASNLRDPDSTSARRPSGSTMAPSLSVHQLRRAPSYLRYSIPPAAHHPSFPLAPLGSSFSPAPLWPSGSPPPPRSPEPSALPWPSWSSVSPWLIGSTSPPWTPPWSRQPFLHHNSGSS